MSLGETTINDRKRILAIVPAFNEAATVARVVKVLSAQASVSCLVVDDGSIDNTAELAREAGASVVSFPTNLGIGAALRAGFMFAERGGYEVALQFDGDGQHDVASIQDLVQPVLDGTADLAIGSRFRGVVHYEVSRIRRAAMRLVALVVRSVTGLRITDPTSGFRAFSHNAIRLFAKNYPIDYMDSFEAIVIAHHADLAVTEVPVIMSARDHGRSSARIGGAVWHTLRAILAVYLAHWQPIKRSYIRG